MIREIMTDYHAGRLDILDFQPRRKTTAQIIKEYNDHLKEYGISPIKIPGKKSNDPDSQYWNDRRAELEELLEMDTDSL